MAGNSMETTETTTTTEHLDGSADATTAAAREEQVVSQAHNPDAVKRAIQAEREAAKAARKELEAVQARLKDFEDRDKSDLERITGERDDLKSRIGDLESHTMRLDVATRKNLPAELIGRLQGSTVEELEHDADQLLSLVATTTHGPADLGARDGTSSQITDPDVIKGMTPAQRVKAYSEGRLNAALGRSDS